MCFLLLYFFAGLLASIYVLLRSGCEPGERAESVITIVILACAWPIVLTAPWWIRIGSAIGRACHDRDR